MKLHTVL